MVKLYGCKEGVDMANASDGSGGGAHTDTIFSLAQKAASQLGWNATFVAKQWALETGNFKSDVFKIDHNPAGIKWYPGMTYGTKGLAASDGGYYAKFSDPVSGYVNFVKNNHRYSNVGNSQDPYTEAQTIRADGWATDPKYVSKVMGMKVDGSQTVNVSSNASTDSGSSTGTGAFGLPDIPALITKSLGVIVGAGIVFLGIWVALNPLSDLTTAIASTVKQFSKMPLEGVTKSVKNAPTAARKRKEANQVKKTEKVQKHNENKALDKQLALLDKHITKLDKKRMG